MCFLSAGGTAHAGPYQWWAWTGGAGDNDLLNPADWLWSTYSNPGNGNVGTTLNGWYYPAYTTGNGGACVVNQRSQIYGSLGSGGSKLAIVPSTENINFTYSGVGIGGGVTIDVNGGTLTMNGAPADNGLWNDPLAAAQASATSDGQKITSPGFLPSTIEVTNGGSFTVGGISNAFSSGANGNLGVYINGNATVNVTGAYNTGSNNTSNYYGGGFLTVQGYNAASSLTIQDLELEPANQTANVSGPGTLNIILDGSNGHGTSNNFNTVSVPGYLNIPNATGGSHPAVPVNVTLVLSGYSPQAGDWFQILNAPFLHTGTVTNGYNAGTLTQAGDGIIGGLAPITINGTSTSWNTPFTVGTGTFELEQSYLYNGTLGSGTSPGVWLEVVSVVPEPSTFALLIVGGTGLLGYVWRRRKRTGV